jgi:hypothetical protein
MRLKNNISSYACDKLTTMSYLLKSTTDDIAHRPKKNLVLKIMPNVHGTMPFIRSLDGLGSKSIPDQ